MLNQNRLTRRTLYYLGLFIYVLSYNIQCSYAHNEWVISQSPFLTVIKLMRYAAYLLCIIHLCSLCRVNLYSIGAVVILFLFAAYATHTGPQRAPLFYFVMLVTGIQTDFRKCVKIFLAIQLTTFVLYLTLAALGISGADLVVEKGRIRYFLGYGWVNRASYNWFFICLEILYLKKCRLNLILGAVLAIVNYYVYIKTHTVFSMSMTFGVIGYGMLNHYYSRLIRRKGRTDYRLVYRLTAAFFVAMLVIGIVLPMIYNPGNPVMFRLNKLVTSRLSLAKQAIREYGLHLGGNKLQWVGSSTLLFGLNDGTEYFYVDNGFLQMALEFGVLFTAFIVFIYIASLKMACALENTDLVTVITILAILFVFEPYVVDFAFNPFVLYFFSTITINPNAERPINKLKRVKSIRIIQS